MIDSLGAPQTVLVLGATSDIAGATLARLSRTGRLERVVLAGRPGPERDAAAERVAATGVPRVESLDFDARERSSAPAVVAAAFDGGDIDVVLLSWGVLPDEAAMRRDPSAAADLVDVNYTSVAKIQKRYLPGAQDVYRGTHQRLRQLAAQHRP